MSDFSAFKVQPLTGNTWTTPTADATLYITKDGVTLKLNSEEIIQLVKTMEATFRR